ncbi:uncharacterized protein [Prorops nasuta]|uniref:uncharacterized protein n=1 Tax=Prorops nasuta TaxID=863751 RepID=UPI0034CDECFA
MGCSQSSPKSKNGSLRLITSKLSFNVDQLNNLNAYFRKITKDECKLPDRGNIAWIEATVERLVQRLIMGVGNLDPRFSSMFLISLNESRRIKQNKFEYLVRLDALSTPAFDHEMEDAVNVEEDAAMPGFARLAICATIAESWTEFLGSAGRLRRDLIKAKLTNLLAETIKQDSSEEETNILYPSPGQVVDAESLQNILKQPNHVRIFYGPAHSDGAFPVPKDHRIVLVEDSGGILLKIGLQGLRTGDIEVRLLVGVGISSWSNLSDYPQRIPLYHCDALLHNTAAKSGMYAIAVGPYPGARCEDRSTLWRIHTPAVETVMNQHYSDDSVPALTESTLMEILEQLRQRRPLDLSIKQKDCLRVVSRHIVRTVHRWSLERTGPDPLSSWAPDTLSHHVLLALDDLVMALKCQNLRCYFHPRCNVMLHCARGGELYHEDSYLSDARLLESYLSALHHRSFNMVPYNPSPMDLLEKELIIRWRTVMASLPRGTMNADYGYSSRQLEYLSIVLQEVLQAKDALLQEKRGNCSYLGQFVASHTIEPIENLIYLLKLILKQARDQIYVLSDYKSRKRNRRLVLRDRKHCNTLTYFQHSSDLLIDAVRKDRETAYLDLETPIIMTKILLRWLYFAMEHDRKILGPILKPYLGNLFNASLENGWHIETWRKRQESYSSEMRSLGMFCKLVLTNEVSPGNGLVESFSRGWRWAESVTRMIERSGNSLRMVFVTPQGVSKYTLTFANNKSLSSYPTWSKARSINNTIRKRRMLVTPLIDSMMEFVPTDNEIYKGAVAHIELRNTSPLTYTISMSRRRGRQRGPGNLISALISLNKFRILQEVAAVLPQKDRIAMLDMIQRVARESSRRLRRASFPDSASIGLPRQSYTAKSETNLADSSERLSPIIRQRCVIAERQSQLRREMQEMHDTLTRGLRTRQQIPSWDSHSLASRTSSIESAGPARRRTRKRCESLWNSFRGSSRLWDNVDTNSNVSKIRSDEMESREESPKWNSLDYRRTFDSYDISEGDCLPSWEILEATLNKRLTKLNSGESDSLEINKDVSIDYILTTNPKKEHL